MKKITAMILALMMCISLIIPASAASGTYFTIGGATANVGDTIKLPISFTSDVTVMAIGIDISKGYDKSVLEFDGFENMASFASDPMFETYDEDKQLISLGWKKAQDFSSGIKVCDVCFKVIGKGNITVSGKPAVKDSTGSGEISVATPEANVKATMKQFAGITFAGAEYTYDGTAKALSVSGAPADATVTYTCSNFDENGKAINAGTYNITATVKKDGYDDWTDTKTLTINPKALTITGLSAQDKIYDGTDKATLSGGTLSGKVGNDDVSATIPTEGKFADKNVGNNKAVTINTIDLSGAKKDNYTLTQPTGLKANITQKVISVTADNQQMIKNGTMPTLTYTADNLCDGDSFTGTLSTKADGKSVGTFDIEQGTLTAGNNYKINFTKGTLTVSDKTPQEATVSAMPEKTYGDDGFKVEVTNDKNTDLGKFTFESSNPNVATIDENGNVTIKNAGDTNIIVKRSGNDTYADFEKSQKLTVKKVAITVNADAKSKRVGTDDPTLTYQYAGTLVGTDKFTGELKRAEGETVGKYDILQNTLKINDNYDITYNKATFEILDKNPQNITVADFGEKTYGDTAFAISVTPDATSNLSNFTYVSDNENVAKISADGTITIVGAGEANITVTEAGNADYAQASVTKKLTVKEKEITVTSVNLENKTATLDGVLTVDSENVTLDFDKIKTTVTATTTNTDNETTTVTSTVKVTNFKLTGDKAGNYVAKETPITTKVSKTTISEKLTEDENTAITAAQADDKTIVVTDVTVTASGESEENTTITIDTTAIENAEIETVVFPAAVVNSLVNEGNASLEIKVNDGNGNDATIVLNASALSAIQTAVGENSAATISISAVKAENDDLSAEQSAKVNEVSSKSPVVYALSILDENGNSVASGFGESGTATVTLSYTKPSGNGNIIVVYLDNAGNTTSISNPKYDSTNNTITITLGHFSEYMIYTEPVVSHGGGGSSASTYTVKFETNGGSNVESIKVDKNKTVAKPTAPTKDGFDFAGWYTDKALTTKYDFDTKVTKGITLYAAWTEKKAEIKDDNTEPTTPENKITFTDVKENDWFAENVKYVFENGLMNGTTDTEFAPKENLTRAMLVTILYRAEGEPETNKSVPFADVTADSYYANAVIWAQQNGIVSGVNENEFAPDENITREQIATIIYRYAKFKGYDTSAKADISSFTDASEISEYATEAMQYAVGSGLIKGKTETTLNPQDNATRAEIAAILQRFIEANK